MSFSQYGKMGFMEFWIVFERGRELRLVRHDSFGLELYGLQE
jgi:hypothetical protein